MDGTAAVGASTKYAREDHVHPTDTSREAVTNKTTVVLGASDSQYPTDKAVADFVNSSIATNTAHYISDDGDPFTSVADLEAYTGTVTNNDYAFVTGTDSEGNTYYDRYKATDDGSTITWSREYRLNNSSFTAAQWAAINSGITAALASAINTHINDSSIHLPSVLPISRGGTGADDRAEAEYNLLGSIADSDISDETTLDSRKIPLVNSSISSTNGVFRFLSFSIIWNWIKHKFGISSSGSSTKFLNEQGTWTTVTTPDMSGKADKVSGATAGDVATLDEYGNLVDSGKTLGKSVPANAVFTDTKVTQMKDDSGATAYPILMAGAADPDGDATTARYDSGVKLTPSTNTISANISGNAGSATVLANARSVHVNLESNTGANFNGSANIEPGVKGVLPQAFGGTGYNTVDTTPTENSNKMVVSGGVWNYSLPANLGILSGSSVNVNNDFDNCDRFVVLVTSDVRLRTYWLSKKSGRIIEFYNLNDYQISINVVIEIGQTVVFHRQGASDITWTNRGSTTSAQTLCQLSYKGYCKFYVTYDSTTGQFDIYQNSDFLYATGTLTSSMIGNVGTTGEINTDTNAEKDSKTDIIYHHDIICNNATGYYAVNIERLIIGQVYRFQFLTQDGYTYLYNNSSETVTIYTGDTFFRVAPGWNANIQASSSAVSSHTVSVVRTSATMIYVIWGY